MNKKELIAKIATEAGVSQVDADRVFKATVEVIQHAMKQRNDVVIPGFLAFKVKKRAAAVRRNPATGAQINVPAREVVVVKVGSLLKTI